MLKLKIKRLSEHAKLPVQATPGSGCWDVYASSDPFLSERYVEYSTGLAFELPEGYDMLIFPRSSVSKTDLVLANGVGFLDQDYRGELKFRFKLLTETSYNATKQVMDSLQSIVGSNMSMKNIPIIYQKGDRIGQIMLIKRNPFVLEEVDELSSTERGTGGFGSTGE